MNVPGSIATPGIVVRTMCGQPTTKTCCHSVLQWHIFSPSNPMVPEEATKEKTEPNYTGSCIKLKAEHVQPAQHAVQIELAAKYAAAQSNV